MGYITYPRSGGSTKDATRAQAAIVLIEQLLIHFNPNDLNSLLALVARIGWANLPPELRARLWHLLYYDLFASIQTLATADYNVSQKRMQALTQALTAAALKRSEQDALPLHQRITASAQVSATLARKTPHATYHSEVLVFDNGMHAVLTADTTTDQYPSNAESLIATALRAHDASARETLKTAHRQGRLVTMNLLADYVVQTSTEQGVVYSYDIAKIPQGLLSHEVVLLAVLRAVYPRYQKGHATLPDQPMRTTASIEDTQQLHISAGVKKILEYAGEGLCLVVHDTQGTPDGSSSALKQLALHASQAHPLVLLEVNAPLSDFTVSAVGTIWAIDRLGRLYSSKPELKGAQNEELLLYSDGLEWSVQSITSATPVCIVGQDDDLWIATQEGQLLHYDGQNFSSFVGIDMPTGMKEVNGRYFLMGPSQQLLEYRGGDWHSLAFAQAVPADITINDVTELNGELIVVSNLGLILRQQKDGLLTVLLDTPSIPWSGCDVLHDTLYLAGGSHGAYCLTGTSVISIQHNADILAVARIAEHLAYLLAPTANPLVLGYMPNDEQPWRLIKA